MTDRIEPALTAERWRIVQGGELRAITDSCSDNWGHVETPSVSDLPDIIALANAALKDDDKRKITRERISDMKETAALARDALAVYGDEATWGNVPRRLAAMIDRTEAFAFALENYLPPE